MRPSILTALLVLCCTAPLAGGCKKKQQESTGPECYLAVFPDDAPLGAAVLLNGKKVGYGIEKGPRWEGEYQAGLDGPPQKVPTEHPIGLVCIPPETWLSDGGALAIERKTPCGDRPVPLSFRTPVTREFEERAREDRAKRSGRIPTVFVDLKDAAPLARTSVYWAPPKDEPLAQDTTLSIGQATHTFFKGYHPKGNSVEPVTMFALDCQAKHTVKVGDREVGTLEITEGAPKGVIVNERGGCMRLANVLYKDSSSPGTGGGWETHLSGPILIMKNVDRIDHFLDPAPSAKSAVRHTKYSVIELVPEECGAAQEAPIKSGGPGKGGRGSGKLR